MSEDGLGELSGLNRLSLDRFIYQERITPDEQATEHS